jgi:hypothetical protein
MAQQTPNLFVRAIEEEKSKDVELRDASAYFASFEAKAGNLYYLGSAKLMRQGGSGTLEVDTSNLGDMHKYVEENYKNLTKAVELIEINPIKPGEFFKK